MEFKYNKKIEGNFRIVEFTLSHSYFRIKSEIDDLNNINEETGKYFADRKEILFIGTDYVEIPTFMDDIEFLEPTIEDWDYIKGKMNKEMYPRFHKIFKIRSGGKIYYVLAGACRITCKYD